MNHILRELKEFLSESTFDYYLCGGYALDCHLSMITRDHSDIDIGASYSSKLEIITYMLEKDWLVFEAHGGGRVKKVEKLSADHINNKKNLFCARKNCTRIEVTPVDEVFYKFSLTDKVQTNLDYVEFLFNECDDQYFKYHWNNDIRVPLDKAIIEVDEFCILAPEIALLYKAMKAEDKTYTSDFETVLPHLNTESKEWLLGKIRQEYNGCHKWISYLEKE